MANIQETVMLCFLKKIMLRLLVFIAVVAFLSLSAFAQVGSDMVFLTIPNSCLKLERVNGNQVFLKSAAEAEGCSGPPSKLPVPIESAATTVEVYIDGRFNGKQSVERTNIKEISARGRQEAEKTFDYYQSEAFRKRYDDEVARLKTSLFKDALDGYYDDRGNDKVTTKAGRLPDSERIYIFVSASVPMATLRNYARDIDRLNDPHVVLVMRGFVGGMKHIKPTLSLVRRIIAKDQACDSGRGKCESYRVAMQVDPLLFRKYGIDRVPASVYVPDAHVIDASLSEGMVDNMAAKEHYVLHGDASLAHVLEAFRKESGRKSIEQLLESLKGGIYGKENKS